MSASIFIVEDERLVAEDIRLSLISSGYTVTGIAASRDQAVEAIGRTSPDLVLMDIILKGSGDGIETAQIVRARFDIPVLYLTAHADLATLRRARISEPFGYVVKPFEERELLTAIEMALYRHRAEKRLEEKEQWLATILASITEGVIAADAMGAIKLVNRAAERIGGWRQEEMLGLDMADAYRVQDPATGLAEEVPPLTRLLQDGAAWAAARERLLVCSGGGTKRIEQSLSPICDRAGTASGSVVVFREIGGEPGRGDQP
jgi:two-component system, cell cycle sensor histidine kinase and response regulator CckA